MRVRPAITSSALAILWWVSASASELGDQLATDDPRVLARAVGEAEGSGTTPDLLYAAGRACEDKLGDPARALALYDRVLREQPDSKAALGAEHRAVHLRTLVGGGHGAEAQAFVRLVADSPSLAPAVVVVRGEALAAAAWPGAAEATLWLAEWLRAHGSFGPAEAHYAMLLARWPEGPEARLAATGRVGAAIDAHAYDRARALIATLPKAGAEELAVRADLQRALDRGLLRERLDLVAQLVLALVLAMLLGSLSEAAVRGGWRRPALRPPLEIWFLGPLAVVLAAASFTANQAIAPAVLRISITGVVLAWISGTTLDLLRARGRGIRLRALGHIALCTLGVLAIADLAISSSGLFDLLVETLHSGPE